MTACRCYLRVSTEDQVREGYSLGAQRDRLAAFALSQGWSVAGWYADEGLSARDLKRPGLQRLMAEVQPGEVVLVYRLDRLTRNVADLDGLLRRWDGEGVRFRSCTEDFNTTTAAGRLFIRLVADLAQWERENLAERTRMGMARRAREGERNGGPAPFGYALQNGTLTPDHNAPVIRELFERYVAGQGVRQLAIWLNREKQVPSPRGGTFSDSTVSAILQNPVYMGALAWGRGGSESVLAEGRHQPLISPGLWEAAQAARTRRRALPPRHATGGALLTGPGRCALCGAYLKAHRSRRGALAYRCGHYAARGTCTLAAVDAVRADAAVLAALLRAAPRLAPAHLLTGGRKQPCDLQRALAGARRALSAWDRALEEGRITAAEWALKTAPHGDRIANLQAQLHTSVELVHSPVEELLPLWQRASLPERKGLLAALCQEVQLGPDGQVTLVLRASPENGYLLPSPSITAEGLAALRLGSLLNERHPTGGDVVTSVGVEI